MGSLVLKSLGVGAATVSLAIFGCGVASADALIGKTYDEAASLVSGWHGNAVIGTVSGSQLTTDDCIVVSWQKSLFLDTSGRNSRSTDYVMHLNCNNKFASPGHPGNSLSTPEGSLAKKDQQAAINISKNPAYCEQNEEYAQACKLICERTGLCEV
jgi:hypothetical protein